MKVYGFTRKNGQVHIGETGKQFTKCGSPGAACSHWKTIDNLDNVNPNKLCKRCFAGRFRDNNEPTQAIHIHFSGASGMSMQERETLFFLARAVIDKIKAENIKITHLDRKTIMSKPLFKFRLDKRDQARVNTNFDLVISNDRVRKILEAEGWVAYSSGWKKEVNL